MKDWYIKLLLISLLLIGVVFTVKEGLLNFSMEQEKPVTYLEELKIGEEEILLSGYGLESFLSNEKRGAVIAKPKEGWEIAEVRYYPENDLNIKGGKKGNATQVIINNVFSGAEEKSRKIEMNAPVEYGACYTHFYIYLQNSENGMKSKEAVTVFAYDELIIDWGKMVDGQTQFVFNLDYLEGDELKNDDWIMVYKKEPAKNNVAEFSSIEEFIFDSSHYWLGDSFEGEYNYRENGNQIVIRIKKDFGLRSVRVENGGEGTGIKWVRS
ncbi:hypothetical protein [Anaerotignum sp. MB30-C6]|uniref:hypothetical protein n=1 Tax=Anaerotignum sp. MB30-C6 TaxID=3070814 RepID=UPI0027DD641C|nr:hypothetical protein [Anaerotignum sp. MB30-C6]WMI80025.1 hypothetical protein RBQ60_09245 [Anaerotignum sp. MB30-C6]